MAVNNSLLHNKSEFYKITQYTETREDNNSDVIYGDRRALLHKGNCNTLSGGYLVAGSDIMKIEGGQHDKVVVTETACRASGGTDIKGLLFFEPTLMSISADSHITKAVMFYGPNLSGVPNISNVDQIVAFQCDHPNSPIIVNGSVYGEYGYSLSVQGKELSPSIGTGYVDNRYYQGAGCSGRVGNNILNDIIYFTPFHVSEKWSPTEIGLEVITGTPGNMVCGIYNSLNGLPYTKIVESSELSVATSGYKSSSITATLPTGTYFLAVHASAIVNVAFANCSLLSSINGCDSFDTDLATTANSFYVGSVYNSTLPSIIPSVVYAGTNNIAPNLLLRKVDLA